MKHALLLFRNPRKTERGAGSFLVRLAVPAAPFALLAVLALGSASCAGLRLSPQLPNALNSEKTLGRIFNDPNWYAQFGNRIAAQDNTSKKAERDRYVLALKAVVDRNYQVYRGKFSGGQAGLDFAFDATSVVLAGAGTLTNGSRAKTVISAITSAVSGLSGKAASDFFAGQQRAVILQRMDALRNAKAAQIAALLLQGNYDDYPFEAAYTDMLDYFYLGTPGAAIADIQTQSGVIQQKASEARMRNLRLP
jgi:hypothetical protein